MNTETTTVQIIPLDGPPDTLLSIYPGQQGPQDCYIALDLRDGQMQASYNPEIGNAVPSDVWHGIIRRYPIPVLQPATVNALMERIAPLAQRVLDGSEIVWDGSNHVARLNHDAVMAEEEICGDGAGMFVGDDWIDTSVGVLYSLESDVFWWDASDWLDMERRAIIERIREGESVKDLAREFDGDGSDEDMPVLMGITDYLEYLKTEV